MADEMQVGKVEFQDPNFRQNGSTKPPAAVVDVPPKIPPNLGPFVLDPLNHAIAAGEREALKLGVPTHDVLEMLINHVSSVVSMIEPAGVRAEALKDVLRAIPELVRKHVDVRHTSSGGIFMPNYTNDAPIP